MDGQGVSGMLATNIIKDWNFWNYELLADMWDMNRGKWKF